MPTDDATVLALAPLVHSHARRVPLSRHPVLSQADLVQEGWRGLLEALRTYDPARGAASTHVDRRIHGQMQDALRSFDVLSRMQRRRGDPMPPVLSLDQPRPRRDETLTREERWFPTETLYATLPDDAPPQDAVAIQTQLRDALEQACATLPTRWRLVLHWRYQDALPWQEIAQRLGCTRDWAWSMHRRALARLRPLLADWRTP